MTRKKAHPLDRWASVGKTMRATAKDIAPSFADLSAPLSSITESINTLVEDINSEFKRVQDGKLDFIVAELDLRSWVKALKQELGELACKTPDKSASTAVDVAVHLEFMPCALRFPPLFTVASERFPDLQMGHLSHILQNTHKLNWIPEPAKPLNEYPLLVGQEECDRLKAERRDRIVDQRQSLTYLAAVNLETGMRWLDLAHRDSLTPTQLLYRMKADANHSSNDRGKDESEQGHLVQLELF